MNALNVSVETRTTVVEHLLNSGLRAIRNDIGYLQKFQNNQVEQLVKDGKKRTTNISMVHQDLILFKTNVTNRLNLHDKYLQELHLHVSATNDWHENTNQWKIKTTNNLTTTNKQLIQLKGDHTITRAIQQQQQTQLSSLESTRTTHTYKLATMVSQRINQTVLMQQHIENVQENLTRIITLTINENNVARNHLYEKTSTFINNKIVLLTKTFEVQTLNNMTAVKSLMQKQVKDVNRTTETLLHLVDLAEKDRIQMKRTTTLINFTIEATTKQTTLQINTLDKKINMEKKALKKEMNESHVLDMNVLETTVRTLIQNSKDMSSTSRSILSSSIERLNEKIKNLQSFVQKNDTALNQEIEELKKSLQNISTSISAVASTVLKKKNATNTIIQHIHHFYNATTSTSMNEQDKANEEKEKKRNSLVNQTLAELSLRIDAVQKVVFQQTTTLTNMNTTVDTLRNKLLTANIILGALSRNTTVLMYNQNTQQIQTKTLFQQMKNNEMKNNRTNLQNLNHLSNKISNTFNILSNSIKDNATEHMNAMQTVQNQIVTLDRHVQHQLHAIKTNINQTRSHDRILPKKNEKNISRLQNEIKSMETASTKNHVSLANNFTQTAVLQHHQNIQMEKNVSQINQINMEMIDILKPRMLLSMQLIGQSNCARGSTCHYLIRGALQGDVVHWGTENCALSLTSLNEIEFNQRTTVVKRFTGITATDPLKSYFILERPKETTNSTNIKLCHSRPFSKTLSTPTEQINIVVPSKVAPSITSISFGTWHAASSVVAGASNVILRLKGNISTTTYIRFLPKSTIGCRHPFHEKYNTKYLINTNNNMNNNNVTLPASLESGKYVLCSTIDFGKTYLREPVTLNLIRPHVHGMVATHQLSVEHYRLTLTHMTVGDHIAFVPAMEDGCKGASTNPTNMTTISIASTLASAASSYKLCYAPIGGDKYKGDVLTDEMFYDEGLPLISTNRIMERIAITDVSQSVSSSSIVMGEDTMDGSSVTFVSDYVNGKIQKFTTTALGNTIGELFARDLNQIMGMHRDVISGDLYVCVLNPGHLYRIPKEHASNPTTYPKVLLTSIETPILAPIDLVKDDVSNEIFVLLGGDSSGSITRMILNDNDNQYIVENKWSGTDVVLSLPGSSGMILGGGIALDQNWIYVSEHGTGSVKRFNRDVSRKMEIIVPTGMFKYPQDIIVTSTGSVLVSDLYGNVVYQIYQQKGQKSQEIQEDEGNGSKGESEKDQSWLIDLVAIDLNYPRSIALRERDGKMYVTELNPNRVVEVVPL